MPLHAAANSIRREPDDAITIHKHGIDDGNVGVVRADLHGTHVGQPNRRSSMIYALTSGTIEFTVGDETFTANTGDIVTAPPNTRRQLSGNATLVIISSPAFDPADEQEN